MAATTKVVVREHIVLLFPLYLLVREKKGSKFVICDTGELA